MVTRAPFASYIVATAESAKVNPHLVPSYVGRSAKQMSRWFTNVHRRRVAEANHAMVCENISKMAQILLNNLENALHLFVSVCSCNRRRSVATGPGPGKRPAPGRLELAAVDSAAVAGHTCRALTCRGWKGLATARADVCATASDA